MICQKCQSREANIHIVDKGDFCFDCNNEDMIELFGLDKAVDYDRSFSEYDSEGVLHRFEISNLIMPGFSEWIAQEVDDGYRFEVIIKPEDNQNNAVKSLHEKILQGIGYKTMRCLQDEHYFSNAINIGEKQYSLNDIGTFQIRSKDDGESADIIIDGNRIDINDFGRALTSFEGFNLDYRIKDKSDEVLGKDMALQQININPDAIMLRFEKTLGWFLDRNFLDYKLESAISEALYDRLDDLELLLKYKGQDAARAIGERMKERLMAIDHASDEFPEYLLYLIDRIIE